MSDNLKYTELNNKIMFWVAISFWSIIGAGILGYVGYVAVLVLMEMFQS